VLGYCGTVEIVRTAALFVSVGRVLDGLAKPLAANVNRHVRRGALMKLSGTVVLVTGASRGVGRAIAIECARRGADVVIAARSLDEARGTPGTLAETAAAIEAAGGAVHMVAVDLSDPDSIEAMAEQALAWRGRVDVVVNNAAFMGRAAYHNLDELDLKNWTRQISVNLQAPFLVAKAFVPQMRDNGGGVIANITSGSGLIGEYTVPGITYGTTKAGLNRLSTLLSRDLEPDGIAVFALDPSYTRTELVVQTAEQAGLDASAAHPTEVPATVLADLVEADPVLVSGKIFRTVQGRGPVVVADRTDPQPEGYELDLTDGAST
jgi:NAD(P)-dependent dehydrogenase (short-subunit alcohol dehydrogenase family)